MSDNFQNDCQNNWNPNLQNKDAKGEGRGSKMNGFGSARLS